MKYLNIFTVLLITVVSLPAVPSPIPDIYAQQRQQFIAAEQALDSGERMKYWDILSTLRDYPLYPYLRFMDLQSRISKARTDEILSYIQAFEDSPVSSRLRTVWLQSLADKQQWQDFLKYYKPTNNRSLICLRERARIATLQDYNRNAQIKAIWLSGSSLPEECDTLINYWEKNQLISEQMYRERLRLSLKQNNVKLAQYLLKQLPAGSQKDMNTWIRVYKNPQLIMQKEVLMHADAVSLVRLKFAALAWYYPDKAIEFAEAMPQYSHLDILQGTVKQILAISLARKFHPQADQCLQRVPEKYTSERVIKWKIRNAMQQQDWQQVLAAISTLGKRTREKDQWQYWLARAYAKLGQADKANIIYRELSSNRSYEGFLAADILGMDYTFKHKDLDIDQAFIQSFKNHPGMTRARELMLLKRFSEARSEWNRVTRNLSSRQKASAAWLAYQWGWSNQTIVTLAGLSEWDDLLLRFPLKHMSEINEHTRSTIIDPALALAVIRQESAFQENARSSSNARGLMQLLPSTAREVAQQLQVNLSNLKQLNLPSVNIKLGVYYLNDIKHELMKNPVLAIAAYNAGKSRVRSWLDRANTLPVDVWIETVPFRETRNYLRNILAYSVVYEKRLGLPVRRIRERMPPIPQISTEDVVDI
jgi:soluble lytic murein transglycosylase